jgi:hypothetical protein
MRGQTISRTYDGDCARHGFLELGVEVRVLIPSSAVVGMDSCLHVILTFPFPSSPLPLLPLPLSLPPLHPFPPHQSPSTTYKSPQEPPPRLPCLAYGHRPRRDPPRLSGGGPVLR